MSCKLWIFDSWKVDISSHVQSQQKFKRPVTESVFPELSIFRTNLSRLLHCTVLFYNNWLTFCQHLDNCKNILLRMMFWYFRDGTRIVPTVCGVQSSLAWRVQCTLVLLYHKTWGFPTRKYSWTSSATRILFKLLKVTMTSQSRAHPNKEKAKQLTLQRYNGEKVNQYENRFQSSNPRYIFDEHSNAALSWRKIRFHPRSRDTERTSCFGPGNLDISKKSKRKNFVSFFEDDFLKVILTDLGKNGIITVLFLLYK